MNNKDLYFLIESQRIYVYLYDFDELKHMYLNGEDYYDFDNDLEYLKTEILNQLNSNNFDNYKLFYAIDKDLKPFEKPFIVEFPAQKIVFTDLKKQFEDYKNKNKKQKTVVKREKINIFFEIRATNLYVFENEKPLKLKNKEFFDVNEEIDLLEDLLLNYFDESDLNSFNIKYSIDKDTKIIENYLKSVFGKEIEKVQPKRDIKQEGIDLYNLGMEYFNKKDYVKAVELFVKASELENANAINQLGECYYNGTGIQIDYQEIIKILYINTFNLFEKESVSSIKIIDHYYIDNELTFRNYKKAFELFEKATSFGNSDAINNLGICYEKGNGVKKDYNKSFELYEKGAKLGNHNAIMNLGSAYNLERGVEKDYKKAIELFNN